MKQKFTLDRIEKLIFSFFLLFVCSVGASASSTFTIEYEGLIYKITKYYTKGVEDCAMVDPSNFKGDVKIAAYVPYEKEKFPVRGFTSIISKNSEITSIYLPETLQYSDVEYLAFYFGNADCELLTAINVDENNPLYSSVNGVVYNKEKTRILKVPSGFKGHYTMLDNVETMSSYAFWKCDKLTEVTLSAKISSLDAFLDRPAPSLTRINVNEENPYYTSDGDIVFNKDRSILSMYLKTGLSEYIVPSSVTQIGQKAFYNCSELSSIILPEGVKSISLCAFQGCSGLSSITIPNTVETIESYAFQDCTGLTSITIPKATTKIGDKIFAGCQLSVIVMYCTNVNAKYNTSWYTYVFDNMASSPIIFTYEMGSVQKYYKGSIKSLSEAENIKISPLIRGARVSMVPDTEFTLKKVLCNDKEILPNNNGVYYIDGLGSGKKYVLNIYNDYHGTEVIMTPNFYTTAISITPKYEVTQTTLRLGDIETTTDETVQILKKYYRVNYYEREVGDVVEGLVPNTSFRDFYAYVQFSDSTQNYVSVYCSTLGLSPVFKEQKSTPTTISCKIEREEGDAHIDKEQTTIRINNKDSVIIGNKLFITGLEPETNYLISYQVNTKEKSKETISTSVKTSKIEFTNQTPKVTADGTAIVAAKTNIADEEINVGFEWRKTDAPETVPSKQGAAAIYDGTMEGLLKNLQSSSYYNVRPYYKSATEKMYYGEWIGIDPSDFSYFEPTVHTYDYVEVQEGVAVLTGYALPGTDDVIEQGFEYWEVQGSNASRRTPQNVQTIAATGQRMTVTLTGLKAGTTYGFRAYVKTAKDTTYGEERTFQTPAATGINVIYKNDEDVVKPQTFNVYTLSGSMVRHQATSLEGLPRGIYIVNRKKVVIR